MSAAETGSAPGRRFFLLLGAGSAIIVLGLWALGWSKGIAGDLFGFAGSLALIYATMQSLGTRRIADIAGLSQQQLGDPVRDALQSLDLRTQERTRREIAIEWRASALGAAGLAVSLALRLLG